MATPGPASPRTYPNGRRASTHISTTEFAKKFGPVTGSRLIDDTEWSIVNSLAIQGRSGHTPTLPPSIIPPAVNSPGFRAKTPNAVASYDDNDIDRLQRHMLFGFTSGELVDHGMFPDLNAKRANNVLCPILDILKINNVWESLENPPVTGIWILFTKPKISPWYDHLPKDLVWRAQEPVIAEMLDPILRLVSRVLTEQHTNTVLRALCEGEIREQPPEKWRRDSPLDKQAWSFHSQPLRDNRIDPEELFEFMCRDGWLSIGFYDEDYPFSPKYPANPNFKAYGITWSDSTKIEKKVTHVSILLNVAHVQPLLRNDLSISEKLTGEFSCAVTLAHEMQHAAFRSIKEYYDKAGGVQLPMDRLDGEPYFENESIAELGHAHDNVVLDGITGPFLRGRFEHIDKRRDFPRLVYYVQTWPDRAQANFKHRLDDFKIPTNCRIRPIQATYYQSIQDHEFWDLMVRKYGVEVVHPPSVVHITFPGSDPAGPKLVVDVKTRIWEKDWPETTDDPNEIIQSLVKKTKAESDLYKVHLRLKLERLRTEERADFRNGRWDFSSQSRQLWKIADASWEAEPEGKTSKKLQELLKLLDEEADKHIKEISAFKFQNDQDLNHLEFLKELNHHMRRMAISVREDTKEIKDDIMSIQDEADKIVNKFDICLVMLHDQGRTSVSPTDFHNQVKLEATPAAIHALVAADIYAQIDPAQRDQLLQEGEDAIKNNDEVECVRIAGELANSYAHIPFFRVVIMLLLSHNSKSKYRRILEDLAPDQIASLMKPNKVCSESIRKIWLNIWTSHVSPSSSTSASGNKRRREEELHEEGDTDGEAEKNRLFLKRFRHDDPGTRQARDQCTPNFQGDRGVIDGRKAGTIR